MEALQPKAEGAVWMEGRCIEGEAWASLSGNSRVWLYTANRLLTVEEQVKLPPAIELFLSDWIAHGQSLQASWRLEGGRCLVIALDERSPHATGCSIDAKVHWLQALGQEWGIDWLSRSFVTYYIEDACSWQDIPLASFWAARKAGVVDGETRVVNSVVSKKLECEPTLVRPFRSSWHEEMWR